MPKSLQQWTCCHSALMALKSVGCLVLAGISLKPQSLATLVITGRELTLKGSLGYRVTDFEAALQVIADKSLEVAPYITGTVGLSDVQQACETLYAGVSGDVKILIDPWKA
ncbi:MAG: hypothetical protein V1793_01230 [Pseudomonadota bacterium]